MRGHKMNSVVVGGRLSSQVNAQMPVSNLLADYDYTSEIPDECLALIFQTLSSADRKRCSLVCRRWFAVEGPSRQRLSLNAAGYVQSHIPSIFARFDSITKLALRCDRKLVSINDDGLALVSLHCRNLTRLKVRGCREITDIGLTYISINCKKLKKFSCGSCMFGAKGINALLNHCSSIEELSVKRLRGVTDGDSEPISPGAAASSLRCICLREVYNGLDFSPVIIGSKNLRALKILRCLGDWDRLFESFALRNENHLLEIHLERLQISDIGLRALSKCSELEVLHLMKALDCTNDGIVALAERCKLLRKLHLDGWKSDKIGDEGLMAIAKHCVNIHELVLIGLNPSFLSIAAIASGCKKLERLALCGSSTITDVEISYVAEKCVALRKLCIKGCEVTDRGIEAFAWGCPNLVKIKIQKCREVNNEAAEWLRARRSSLIVSLDVEEVEATDVSPSDVGDQEDGGVVVGGGANANRTAPLTINGTRPSLFKSRVGLFGGRGFACTFGRWLGGGSGSGSGSSG